jgi:hypothetical protein
MFDDCKLKAINLAGYCRKHKGGRDDNVVVVYCKRDGCKNVGQSRGKSRGYCNKHPNGAANNFCKFVDCTRQASTGGYCYNHKGGHDNLCLNDDCTRQAMLSGGYCRFHKGGRDYNNAGIVFCKRNGCTGKAKVDGYCKMHRLCSQDNDEIKFGMDCGSTIATRSINESSPIHGMDWEFDPSNQIVLEGTHTTLSDESNMDRKMPARNIPVKITQTIINHESGAVISKKRSMEDAEFEVDHQALLEVLQSKKVKISPKITDINVNHCPSKQSLVIEQQLKSMFNNDADGTTEDTEFSDIPTFPV